MGTPERYIMYVMWARPGRSIFHAVRSGVLPCADRSTASEPAAGASAARRRGNPPDTRSRYAARRGRAAGCAQPVAADREFRQQVKGAGAHRPCRELSAPPACCHHRDGREVRCVNPALTRPRCWVVGTRASRHRVVQQLCPPSYSFDDLVGAARINGEIVRPSARADRVAAHRDGGNARGGALDGAGRQVT